MKQLWNVFNKIPDWFWLILIILPLLSILRPGSYESGGLTINAVKLLSFTQSLSEGILIPRWSGELNATYGYPNFLFAYPLPYYLGAFFHFLGLSLVASIKMVLVVSYLLAGVFMYGWLRSFLKSSSATFGALLYVFAPYMLMNLHFQVAIGELLAKAWLPLAFWLMKRWVETKKIENAAGLAVTIALLILSHQAVSLIGLPVIVAYGLLLAKSWNWRRLIAIVLPVVLGLALSAYYWLPVLGESQFTHQARYVTQVTFDPLLWYLVAPWRWGLLSQGTYGELAPNLGYVQIALLVTAVWLLITNQLRTIQSNRKLLYFFLLVFASYFFMVTELSKPLWEFLSVLRNVQFSQRMMSVLVLVLAVIGALILDTMPKKLAITLALLAVFVTFMNWGNRRVIPGITDAYLADWLPLSTAQGEALHPATPRWADWQNPWQTEVPESQLTVLEGSAQSTQLERRSTYHRYEVTASESSWLKEHTYYFPGWTVLINGQATDIQYESPVARGTLTFWVPAGEHTVEVIFADTPIRIVGKLLSIAAVLCLPVLLILSWRRRKK